MANMIFELIRNEIKKSSKSRYRISKESGISQAQLCRFMQGQKLDCDTMDVLLAYFGYEVVRKKDKAKTKKGR